MFKAQFKSRSPFEVWNAIGTYNDEMNAISSAMYKKRRGALMVRVIDRKGAVVFTN